jgi:type I restriction enzyme S subunit
MFKALDLPIRWDAHKLGDIITHQKGYAFNSSDFQDSGTKVVRISDTTASSINLDSCPCVSHELAKQFERFALKEGDVVITTVGSRPHLIVSSVGKTIRIDAAAEGCLLNQNAVILRPRSTTVLDPQFLYLSLIYRPFRSHIEKLVRGNANQVSITLEDIFAYAVPLPPLAEQKKIVAILSSWDRAVELTEKLIEVKRKLKKGLMHQLLTGKRRFLGVEGEWKNTPLGQMGRCLSGGTPDTKNSSYWNGEIQWCTPSEITILNSKYISSTRRTLSNEGLNNSSANLLPPNAVIVCTRATVGDCAINTSPMATNQGFKSLILKQEYSPEFVYYLICHNKHQLVRYASGSTFLEISMRDFCDLAFPVPERSEQNKIAQLLNAVDKEIETLCCLSDRLKEQKRGLMQKLLTGQIRVEAIDRV